MKRTNLFALLLCLAMLLSLVACGENHEDSTSAGTTETESQTEGTTAGTDATSGTEATDSTEELPEVETDRPDIEVKEEGDKATVTNSVGLTFEAKGYDGIEGDSFTFAKGLELAFDPADFAEDFNRFSLSYKSSAPVKVYLTYLDKAGNEKTDDFFLEAGDGVFSGLVSDYIDKKNGKNISKLVIDTCENKEATFALYHAETEKIEVYTGRYGSSIYYIQNDQLKLGVDMGWGGALVYLADLTAGIDGLENLVNKHDTGRLIQQSFYGTGAIPGVYEPGEFNGSKWVYNPVQGGDKYNNSSRLIDVQVTETSIYIKAQPQDWSLNNALTPSYMENTYSIIDDYVRVDNRFVDFSGWEHRYAGQELPALYTVSFLDTFVWYNGSEPWTGDALSSRNDLNFWGDSKYVGDCTYALRESNTETWCAWINEKANYGMGLYVPKVDVLKAGRYQYNGSKDPNDGACSYVAPVNSMKMISYLPMEYSYLLTTGSIEEIRATFTEQKAFATNDSLHQNYQSGRLPDQNVDMSSIDFSVDGNYKLFTGGNSAEAIYDAEEKAAKLTVSGGDPYFTLHFANSSKEQIADDYTKIEVTYMIPKGCTATMTAEMFLCTGEVGSPQAGKSIRGNLIADGEYHTLTLTVSGLNFWQGKINQLRFDFFGGAVTAGDTMYVKSIKLVK